MAQVATAAASFESETTPASGAAAADTSQPAPAPAAAPPPPSSPARDDGIYMRLLVDCDPRHAVTVANWDWDEWPAENVSIGLPSADHILQSLRAERRSELPATFVAFRRRVRAADTNRRTADGGDDGDMEKTGSSSSSKGGDDDDDDELIGTVKISPVDLTGYDHLYAPWIASLFVSEAARGCGLAKRLVAHCVQQTRPGAPYAHIGRLHLWCAKDKPWLAAIYAGVGFKTVAEIKYDGLSCGDTTIVMAGPDA